MKKPFQKPLAVSGFIDLATASKRSLVVLSLSLIAACSTPLPPPPPLAPEAAAPSTPAPEPSLQPAPMAAPVAPTESALQAFERMRSGVASESVFFDFDKFAVKADQATAITDNAKLVTSYAKDYLTLQGNCDERGSREYNLALGQRRADSVKARLVLLGVPEERIESVSFGKEKPKAQCHDESCWSENRRADFVHQWKGPAPTAQGAAPTTTFGE